ncbi:NADP-dependent oxidoreductase [Patulibacter sp.]|uniref:quinone oxidoreductase family protein n=1 Tax=Patulibacter sp. TaxID=1912859 RepID=UPI0027237B0A|nr:NADP-dependent oxidoreductase [Patulibacter sp.]MDO9407744.1 NADP-dependent oxidoreductase [Patulibacter sp.]
MRVVVVTEPGDPEVLQTVERPDPAPVAGQAVVRMQAASVNPIDLAARTGWHPPVFEIQDPPYVPGWDLAGEVVAVGEGVEAVAPGDPVVAMIPWHAAGGRYGAYAELVLVEAEWLVTRPAGLDPVAAATVPLNGLTAHQCLAMLAVPAGEELLVTGASGGVGGFAVQLAHAAGVRVTAVAGADDEEWVRGLGADVVLPPDVDLGTVGPFRHVLDAVPLGEPVRAAVAPGGAIVETGGSPALPDGSALTQRMVLVAVDRDALAELLGGLAAGTLRTRVAETLPLAEAAEAHRRSGMRGRRGKTVLVD